MKYNMKKKTSNAERRTPNAELPIICWIGDGRVKEDAPEYGAARKTDSTSNAQRPTSNVQVAEEANRMAALQ
jgi:hypothetical protein